MIKVLVADDHAIVRAGLRALIKAERSMQLVGEASGGAEALELVTKLKPDVLVLDISMPDLDGIEVLGEIIQMLHTKGMRVFICGLNAVLEHMLQENTHFKKIINKDHIYPNLNATLAAIAQKNS